MVNRYRNWQVGVALLGLATAGLAQSTIDGVEVTKSEEAVGIIVRGEGLERPNIQRVMRGQTWIASFSAVLSNRAGSVPANVAGVTQVQWTQFTTRPPVTRVVLRLQPSSVPTLTPVEGGWRIVVGRAIAATGAAPTAAPASRPAPTRSTVIGPDGDAAPLQGPIGRPAKPNPNPLLLPSVTEERVVLSGEVRPATPFRTEVLPGTSARLVTLEFDDAEISQILKALAIQARVNIVTAPEVKGTLTIKLERMTVEQAVNIVTALAGLRYQVVENTIIVAPASRMVDILRSLSFRDPSTGVVTETRIVPIFSGQGRQIKAAAYRMSSQMAASGRYEIVLPSDNVSATGAPPAPVAGSSPPAGGEAPESVANPLTRERDEYVMIIGQRARLDEVEVLIRGLDVQLCQALGIDVPNSVATVQGIHIVRGVAADQLLGALGAKEGMIGSVSVVATPRDSNSRQTIVLTGRQPEVARIMATLRELDGETSLTEEFRIYDVQFSDPRSLREELVTQIPGVRATISPASVGTPRLATGRRQGVSETKATSTPAATAAVQTGQAQSNEGAIRGSEGFQAGLGQPFKDVEPLAQPMRLILRGPREAIDRALRFLELIDVAPRQVALEMRVMELSREDARSVGLDWDLFSGGVVRFIRLNNSLENPRNSVGVNINGSDLNGSVIATLEGIANNTNLIARPNIMAIDGRESEVFVGDVIRYVESIISGQTGPSVQIGEVRVGINLAVLPRVSGEGNVTLDLRPVVSFLRGFNRVSVSGFSAELPQTSERIAQATVTLRSGETIAIGGLIQDQDTKQITGVPILMDLPVLGQFFRRTITRKDRRELVFFVTAKSIDAPLTSGDRLQLQPRAADEVAPTTTGAVRSR